MEEKENINIQKSQERIKVNRNFRYNRSAKETSRSEWNTQVAGKMMMRSIKGFIEKWMGRSFDKCLHEFVNDPRFKDSNGWKMYGTYYTPRKWFDHLFEEPYANYKVDDQGRIYDPDDRHHKPRFKHPHYKQDLVIKTNATPYWQWNMAMVDKYHDELCDAFGYEFVMGLNPGVQITSQEKYDRLDEIICRARIVNKNKPFLSYWNRWRYTAVRDKDGYFPNYLGASDFLIKINNVETIPYGSKQYNSMSKQIAAQEKKEAKERRWQWLAEVQETMQEAQRRRKASNRSFMSEYVQLLNEEKQNEKQ